MGDRCYSIIDTKREHLEVFKQMGYDFETPDQDDGKSDPIQVVEEQSNYGNCTELTQMKGVVFICVNGSGDDYGDSSIVSDSSYTLCVDLAHNGTSPIVEVDDDGEIYDEQLKEARRFIGLRERVKAVLEGKPDTDEGLTCPHCAGQDGAHYRDCQEV